ncbi:MAG: hypothetical protein GY796_11770, partial [Chloroflexi bacterium]|nr:hypothetical protein [Chloroflexota bacterium]
AITGTIFGPIAILLWLATATKLFNFAFGFSIDRVALTILYQPLPATERVRVQTAAEGIVYPLAVGLAGVLLLLLINLFGFGAIQLAYVLFCILAAWIIVATLLGRREYPTQLMQALLKRRLTGAGLSLDKSSATVLQKALQSPHPNVVIYALNMLEESEPDAVAGYLPDLITHPAPEVRQESLQRIERLRLGDALETISQAVETETVPPVQAAALRTLATLCDAEALEQVYPYLEAPDPQVRRGAIVGLLQNAGVEVTIMAEGKLLQMAISQEPTDRMVAAQVIGDVAARNLRHILEQLLQDEDLLVRRTALTAAGQAKYPELWPLVVAGVSVPYIRNAAVAALVAGGETAAIEVQAAFTKPDQDRQTLIRLARVCGRISGSQTTDFLKKNLAFSDNEVRTHILAALSQCGYQAKDGERAMIQQQIKTEIAQAASTVATLVDINANAGKTDHSTLEIDHTEPTVSLLVAVLNDELAQIRTRIFFLLSFIYHAQTILQARDALEQAHASQEKQAYAFEVLDLQLPREIKTNLFPLLQRDLNPHQCLKELNTAFPQANFGRSERLQQIITGPAQQVNSWTKACALYTTALLKLNDDDLVRGIISTIHSYA